MTAAPVPLLGAGLGCGGLSGGVDPTGERLDREIDETNRECPWAINDQPST